jgi:hypothetical protein
MIESSRKHGHFDLRWPTPSDRAQERAAVREAKLLVQAEVRAAEAWETEGGPPRSEPVAVRATVA